MKDKAIMVFDYPKNCIDCKLSYDDRYSIYCGAIPTDDNEVPKDADFHEKCPLIKVPNTYDKGWRYYDGWIHKLVNTARLEELRGYLKDKVGDFTERHEDDFVVALEKPITTETGPKYLMIEIKHEGLYQITVESNWWDEDKEVVVCQNKDSLVRAIKRYLPILGQ